MLPEAAKAPVSRQREGAMPGPLPTADAVRRNKPSIPTTALPASGRPGPAPDPPALYDLRAKALDWWAWAWSTPQAAAWDGGSLFMVARRAQLEDDLDVLEHTDLEIPWLLTEMDENPAKVMSQLQAIVTRLKALTGGKISLLREMRELDDRLGLTPKGLAQLRWKIVDDAKDDGDRSGRSDQTKAKRGRGIKAG